MEARPGKELLTPADAPALAASFHDCVEELADAQPYVGAVRDGQVVSICRSVRKGAAHEAGIETLPAFRRQGYGLAALGCWTASVQQAGAVPLYSASLHNTPSVSLAQKAGYTLYAHTFQIAAP